MPLIPQSYQLIIIGAGPAGYTAAIYAARAGLSPLLYKGMQPGGQLTLTTEVENYPGYPNGVLGPQMMADFEQQAKRFGTDIQNGVVTKVNFSTYPHIITVNDKKNIYAQTVIIATGAQAKVLGIKNEVDLYGKGVSSCAVCDGFFFKNQDVAIVGGGDTAAEEAIYLSKICNKVYMFIRSTTMRASKYMQKKLKEISNIIIFWNTEVAYIIGKERLEYVEVLNKANNTLQRIDIKGLFVAIGHEPNTKIFAEYIDLDSNGYIKIKSGSTKTKIKSVFAAGDVQDPTYRQAITAAATGCMAALDAEKFLATGV